MKKKKHFILNKKKMYKKSHIFLSHLKSFNHMERKKALRNN